MKLPDTAFRIDPVNHENAHHVGTVFRAVYGESFPVRYVYQPDGVLREIEAGRLVSGLALDGDGLPAGYVSMFRVSPNPRLWEAGNVVVVPRNARTDIAFRLVRYGFDLLMDPVIAADGMLSEAVCCHYFTQIHTADIGMIDCGIALDQLDGDSFKDGKSNKAGTERVSCVISFMEVPRWFGSDGLLMQTLLDRETDCDAIKLYSQTAKDLLAFIRSDRETVQGR